MVHCPVPRTVDTLVTKLQRGDDIDDEGAEEDGAVNLHMRKLRRKHLSILFILMLLCFSNSQFSAEHVHQFDLESPTDGWQIAFQQELLTMTHQGVTMRKFSFMSELNML